MDPPLEVLCRAAFAAAYPKLELACIGPSAHSAIIMPPGSEHLKPTSAADSNMWFVRVGGIAPAADAITSRLTLRFAKQRSPEVVTAPWDCNNILMFSPAPRMILLRYQAELTVAESLGPRVDAGSLFGLWEELNLIESPCPARFAPYADDDFVARAQAYRMSLREVIERAEGGARARLERRLALAGKNGGFAAEL